MWKNRLIYILLAAYSCLFVVLYNEYTSFLVSAIVLLLPFGIAGVMKLLICPKIEVSLQENTGYFHQEENTKVILKVENKSVLPILYATAYVRLFYGHGKKQKCEKVKVCVDAKGRREFELTIRPQYCGLVNIEISKVKVYDYFRIYAMSRKGFGRVQRPVWPKKAELEESEKGLLFQKIEMSEEFSKDRPGDDPSEIFDIRAYREGDRLQRIHWKLSSKKDQILVKEFSLPIVEQIVVFVSLEWETYEAADMVIQKLVTVIEYLLEQEKNILVCWCAATGYCKQLISKKNEILILLLQLYENNLSGKEHSQEVLLECLQKEGMENGYLINQNGIRNLEDLVN